MDVGWGEIPAHCSVEKSYEFSFLLLQASDVPREFIWFFIRNKKRNWKQSGINTLPSLPASLSSSLPPAAATAHWWLEQPWKSWNALLKNPLHIPSYMFMRWHSSENIIFYTLDLHESLFFTLIYHKQLMTRIDSIISVQLLKHPFNEALLYSIF